MVFGPTKVVGPIDRGVFSKTGHRIILKLGMKFQNNNGHKLTKPYFLGKISLGGKSMKISQKSGVILMLVLCLRICQNRGFLRIYIGNIKILVIFCSECKTTILNSRRKLDVYSFSISRDIRARRLLWWHNLVSPGEKVNEKLSTSSNISGN